MTTPKAIVQTFWDTMQTNDFEAASRLLSETYVLHWPQSGERVEGRANFAAINQAYPAHGVWRFEVHRLVAEGAEVVSDVSVTGGKVSGRAITFSTIEDGLITAQLEFWPETFTAPTWRSAWVTLE